MYRAYYQRVLRFALKRFGAAVAEDVAADTMERLLRRFQHLDLDRDLWPWLAVVARNAGLDHYRVNRRTVPVDQDCLDALLPYAAPPEDAVLRTEEHRLVRQALRSLRESDQQLLCWREIDRHMPRDIADRLGISAGAMRQRIFRARRNLRAAYLQLAVP